MRRFLIVLASIASVALVGAPALAAGGKTLGEVKQRGHLLCGVSDGLPGFSAVDNQGTWSGLDVDFCRAIASAIFNDPNAVRYSQLNAKERFTALQARNVDLLSRNTTWTMDRDVSLGLEFIAVIYYDGQGFIVRKADNITKAEDLAGGTICTQTGTTTELNVADFFRSRGLQYNVLAYEKDQEAVEVYESGRCDTYTTDQSGLYAQRLDLDNFEDHVVLPQVISKEPLGPVVRSDDTNWEDLVRWTLFAMLNAEELGVSQQNIDQMLTSENPEIKRLVGTEGAFGESLGLTNDWAVRIVRHVGNYGEIFERNVGQGSRLKIDRAQNKLYKDGGLQYAPPIR
jgi:general L-amino acid transport system substrate-binding protein